MGFPFGADEDAAYIIAWLELNRLNGVGIFRDNIEKIDQQYDGVLNLKDCISEVDFKNKSILMKGSGLIDFLQSTIDQDHQILININNCTNGILFLPLLYKANKNIRFLELTYNDSNNDVNIFKIYDNKVFHNIEKVSTKDNKLKIILSNKGINKINSSCKELINDKKIQENLSESLRPKKKDWDIISAIADRTFVPESEESRNRGAGGGDAND